MMWTGAQGLVYGSSQDPLQTCNKPIEWREFYNEICYTANLQNG